MVISTEAPTSIPESPRGQFLGNAMRTKTPGMLYNVYLGKNNFYYFYNGGPDPVHHHSKSLGINAEGFYGYQEIKPDGSRDLITQGIGGGSESQKGVEGSASQLMALKRARLHATLSNIGPTSHVDINGRYTGRPEGTPTPLGDSTSESIIALRLYGEKSPGLPDDTHSAIFQHCA